MSKYTDVIFELAYDNETENIINSLDDELKDIFEKFKSMFISMDHHKWQDDSEIYGGITFGQFKRIYMILLSQIKPDKDNNSLQIPLPCKIGDPVWEIYADDCGNVPCMDNCETCKDAYWKTKQVPFNTDHISKYNETIFLTEYQAKWACERNKAVNEARHKINMKNKPVKNKYDYLIGKSITVKREELFKGAEKVTSVIEFDEDTFGQGKYAVITETGKYIYECEIKEIGD